MQGTFSQFSLKDCKFTLCVIVCFIFFWGGGGGGRDGNQLFFCLLRKKLDNSVTQMMNKFCISASCHPKNVTFSI